MNEVLGTVATFQDISLSRKLARQVESQARHDALTGLLNRREFELKVSQALSLYSEDTTHALLMIDLDRFKVVNDNCGHAAGDELLRQLSQSFRPGLRKSDLVARLGGDEFAVFLSNTPLRVAVEIAEKILARVQEYRFFWEGKAFRVGASIGVVDTSAQGADYNYLYHAADTACYLAKNEGRDRVRVVTLDDELLLERRRESECVNRITQALEENSFLLYAQSIVPLSSLAEGVSHYEVLIHLKDEQGEILQPMAFIPVAERCRLMPEIDGWVIASVIEIIRAHPAARTVYSVNVSGQSLGDAALSEKVVAMIRDSAINPASIGFEISETAAISNMENAKRFMTMLKSMGCSTALDDFGSGLSSFGYLKNLPLDYIKIEGLFVRQIREDLTSYVMVNAIHGVARSLGLRTIAEYVASEATVQKLKDIGVDYGQGFHFDQPAPLSVEMIDRISKTSL
ncbi:MAG: EAL domain-containing protein [Sulfurimicrobium sp.]|nr:EAL domain-containing protein [Sulfurimicrobium sp.]MDP2198967.1 EAL domain-containing protein [Sulfurimicrobium sp.]MDP3687056.1 EAL domain-containing protein [Sulfurimicrobium sp.]